ncbi:hypothetical protein CPC08DRAFT_822049 [Agrocybe pediades]|nr:hypothetical protein CPC08DRAFT_822049 [Agrocybe pediades]
MASIPMMPSELTSSPALNLTTTFGALLIGVVFSAMLYGITVVQAFLYFQNYPSDTLLIKGSVVVLVISETLHSVFGVHAIYYYVITNYLHPEALAKAVWSATVTLTTSTIVVFVVHLFYVKRIYHVTQNLALVALVFLLAMVHAGTSVAIEVRAFQLEFFTAFARIGGLVDTSLALAAATDIITAGILTIYLHKSRSGIASTDTIINRLMIYTINNGILTSIFDVIVIIFETTQIDNLIFLAIYQVVGNLYTNSMMATLNSRKSIRSTGKRDVHIAHGNTTNILMSAFKASSTSNAESGTTAFQPSQSNEYSKSGQDISITTENDAHAM